MTAYPEGFVYAVCSLWQEELWCHRYYLRSLCNEVSYPDWPILDHIQFMQVSYP